MSGRIGQITGTRAVFGDVVAQICALAWRRLDAAELVDVAWAYYYFSIQFRECVEIARALYPSDPQLAELDRGERDTDNLSPWPGIAATGERMDHDEFMRRTLGLHAIDEARRRRLEATGAAYLATVRAIDHRSRALSLASYENGGLAAVFSAILTAQSWDDPLLQAFRHFLQQHISLDADPESGHGALVRHLVPDPQILALWIAFHDVLVGAAPRLAQA
jgi:hypothetical protein